MITKAIIKQFLNVKNLTDDYDDVIDTLITQARRRIKTLCRQPVEKEEVVYSFTGRGSREYTLRYFPVSNLSKLERWRGLTDGWEELEDSTYTILTPNEVATIVRDTCFSNGSLYRATFDVGYDEEDVPADLLAICRSMVLWELKQSNIPDIGLNWLGVAAVTEIIPGGLSGTRTSPRKDMEEQVLMALQPYQAGME